MSKNAEIKARVERVWKELHKYGIYTEEQLEEALKNTEPIDISCMAGEIIRVPSGGDTDEARQTPNT